MLWKVAKKDCNGKSFMTSLTQFVQKNIRELANACFLASEWCYSSSDADKDSDPNLAAQESKRAKSFSKLEKQLRRFFPK